MSADQEVRWLHDPNASGRGLAGAGEDPLG
jgi:hypothetical protein